MKKIIGILTVAVVVLSALLYKAVRKIQSLKKWDKYSDNRFQELHKEVLELREERNEFSKKSPHWDRDLDKEINDLKEEIENKIEEMEKRRD